MVHIRAYTKIDENLRPVIDFPNICLSETVEKGPSAGDLRCALDRVVAGTRERARESRFSVNTSK